MEPISLQQLQEMFAEARAETDFDIDGEIPWNYFFKSTAGEELESITEALEELGFDAVDIAEMTEGDPCFILIVERLEKHTPESLFALNAKLEALASEFKGVEYDGMDVIPADEDECGCGGDCEDCDCDKEDEREHACGCGSKHCHTEDEPVENPGLLAALDRITKNLSEETQHNLTLQLQRGLYLVPVFTGRIDTEPTDDEAVQVLVCTDEKDDEYLPLFTDETALRGWTREQVSAMVLTAPEAWDFILSQPECSGGVVNPGTAGLPLNREMVGLLKKMIDAGEGDSGE